MSSSTNTIKKSNKRKIVAPPSSPTTESVIQDSLDIETAESISSSSSSLTSSSPTTVVAVQEEEKQIAGIVKMAQLVCSRSNKYNAINLYILNNFNLRRQLGLTNTYVAATVNLANIYKLESVEKLQSDGKKKYSLKFAPIEKRDTRASFVTPLGVLSFCTIDFKGNRDVEGELGCKGIFEDIKVSIQWSARAYNDEGRDPESPSHDATSLTQIKWSTDHVTRFFLEKCVENKHFVVLRDFIKEASDKLIKSGIKVPTVNELVKFLADGKFLEAARADKNYDIFSLTPNTKLFRRLSEWEVKNGGLPHYKPTDPFMKEQWETAGLTLNDVPVYKLKKTATDPEQWSRDPNLWELVDRQNIKIPNGTLGCVAFTLAPTHKAGKGVLAVMHYLHSVYIYGPPTSISKAPPVKIVSGDERKILQEKYAEYNAPPPSDFLNNEPEDEVVVVPEDENNKRPRYNEPANLENESGTRSDDEAAAALANEEADAAIASGLGY